MEETQILGLATMEEGTLTLKQVLKKSPIHLKSAKFVLKQYGQDLITIELTDGEFSDIYRKVSNQMFWRLKGKIVRLEKTQPIYLTATLSDGVNSFDFQEERKPKETNGKSVPFNAQSIGTMLKNLLQVIGAGYMIARVNHGHFDKFVHASNNLANFFKVDQPRLPSAKKHTTE